MKSGLTRREWLGAAAGAGMLMRAAEAESIQELIPESRVAAAIEALARYGATPEGGVSRTAGSDADRASRELFASWMQEAGMAVRVDLAGNLIGSIPGSVPGLRPLVAGSHLDSVPDGGNFDGVAGSVAALECARALRENSGEGSGLRHPFEVVVFFNEENGKTGSRALAGEVSAEEMDREVHGGFSLGEALARVGGDPGRITEAALPQGAYHAFLELHIEQSPTLHESGIPIGIVEGIVGIRRFLVTIRGFANHAGTTAMARRKDPMVTAGRFIAAVHDETLAREGHQVATVGWLEAHPGAANVIPGEVELTLEIRDLSMEVIQQMYDRYREIGTRIAERNGTSIHFEPYYLSRAAPCDPGIIELLSASARDLGYPQRRMPSGAGHDAQSIAAFAPIGMIFVPSRDGISHSPLEFTEAGQVAQGARVMLETLRRLDRKESFREAVGF